MPKVPKVRKTLSRIVGTWPCMPCLEWLTFVFGNTGNRGIELEAIEEIKNRCEAAGIDYEVIEGEWTYLWDAEGTQEIIEDFHEEGRVSGLRLKIPRGRETYPVFVQEGACAEWMLSEPFEEFEKLKGYEASWSPTRRVIECNLVPCNPANATYLLLKRRYVEPTSQGPIGFDKHRIVESSAPYSISLGNASNVHTILEREVVTIPLEDWDEVRVRRSWTLRIEGIEATTHDNAVEALERIADSFCFQFDLATNLAIMPEREFIPEDNGASEQLKHKPASSIGFQYDHEALSLYWYAKTSVAMPTFQFLAYYQVLEFYFYRYLRRKAEREILNVLEEQPFKRLPDADKSRLLNVIRHRYEDGKRLGGGERELLKNTIKECVTPYDLRTFIIENDDRYEFYSSTTLPKALSKFVIPILDASPDHRESAAERIYDIRCRIVHAKTGSETQIPLFPSDSETANLRHDIDLVQFLARKAIEIARRPL